MSDSENRYYPNQKLIKIKPVELLRKAPDQEHEHIEKNQEVIQQQKVKAMQKEIEELSQKKQTLVEQTNQTITVEKENWQSEKKQWIEEAKLEGYTAGFKQGEIDGYAEYKSKLEQANHLIDAATNQYHTIIEKSDEAILQLAVNVAGKVLNQQIAEESSTFMGIVKGAIKEIKDQSVVTINLHPSTYDLVVQHREELVRLLEKETKLTIYIDENLAENACLIEHPFGQIDASVDTQLLKIREVLHDYLMEKRS
ncbi:flagellar assembly protein FliH [Oceanobacillus rekensis]|uniref:flagellar assembly protein FliH n=1 Tax=Oceanobacillus rekensis TaxID=937927 RepID=UPI001593CC26|nr:flagellar assembly protein FliH [Oceanobacillus rekensis]